MQRDSDRQGDEDAWRAIVENYGDRPELEEDDPVLLAAPDMTIVPWPTERVEPERYDDVDDEDRFVPPDPPPFPEVPHDRKVAWLGLCGAPAVLLVCLVVGIHLPPLLAYLLVGAFIAGFVYLVATMPRGPVDPFDDGARL